MATSRIEMTQNAANEVQRAGIRRTAWIAGAIALAFFVGFFLLQFYSH